jgi:hypothetical protein
MLVFTLVTIVFVSRYNPHSPDCQLLTFQQASIIVHVKFLCTLSQGFPQG